MGLFFAMGEYPIIDELGPGESAYLSLTLFFYIPVLTDTSFKPLPIDPLAKKIENKTISKCLARYLDQYDLEENLELSKQDFSQKLDIELFDGDEDICNRLKAEVQNVKDRVDEEIRMRGNGEFVKNNNNVKRQQE